MKIASPGLIKLAFVRPFSSDSAKSQRAGWCKRGLQHQHDHELRRVLKSDQPDIERVESLLAKGANPASASLRRGDNAIHALARAHITDREQASILVSKLIEHSHIDIHTPNAEGETPLHLALENQSEVASVLLEKGGANQHTNHSGQSLLNIASEKLEDARRTAKFNYSERQINQKNSTRQVIQDLHRARRLADEVKKNIRQHNKGKRPLYPQESSSALAAQQAEAAVLQQEQKQSEKFLSKPDKR